MDYASGCMKQLPIGRGRGRGSKFRPPVTRGRGIFRGRGPVIDRQDICSNSSQESEGIPRPTLGRGSRNNLTIEHDISSASDTKYGFSGPTGDHNSSPTKILGRGRGLLQSAAVNFSPSPANDSQPTSTKSRPYCPYYYEDPDDDDDDGPFLVTVESSGERVTETFPTQFTDDSEDEMVVISQNLVSRETDDKEEVARFNAFQKTARAALPEPTDPLKVRKMRNSELSSWRLSLRGNNICCLSPGCKREAATRAVFDAWQGVRDSSQFSGWLSKWLSSCDSPLQTALDCLNNFMSRNQGKADGRLTQAFIDGLQCWVQDGGSRASAALASLTDAQRRFTFFLAQREGMAVGRQLVAAFRLDDSSAERVFGDLIDDLVRRGIYREACQFVGLLGLHERYPVEQVLLPVIAENRLAVVEECVAHSETAQRRLLLFLDEHYDEEDKIATYLGRCRHEVMQIQSEHLRPTALRKLALRLKKKFGLPTLALPRLGTNKSSWDLANLVHERFVRRLTRPDWEAAVAAAVGDSHDCAVELVRLLVDYRAPAAARRWAARLGVDVEEVPGLEDTGGDEEEEAALAQEEEEEATPVGGCLPFPLHPRDDVEVVDDEDGLWALVSAAASADKLGFDAEWTTPYGSALTQMSILQIALRDRVFILDIDKLSVCLEEADPWHEFRRQILENSNVCKIFFSAYQDLCLLWQSVPALGKSSLDDGEGDTWPGKSYRQVVDLEEVSGTCRSGCPDFFPPAGDTGLSGLVESALGLPLDKSQRMSNWTRRPLSRRQLVYAALDAHCLILVHDWMERRRDALGLAQLDLCPNASLRPPEKRKKKKTKDNPPRPAVASQASSTSSPSSRPEEIRPDHLRLSVDPALTDTGDLLAACGCQVKVEPPGVSDADRTLVVPCGQAQKVKCQFERREVVVVDEDLSSEEQVRAVLGSLQVQLQSEDFQEPCPVCRARDQVELAPHVVSVLCGDLTSSLSAREQKRLQKRGVDVETGKVTVPGSEKFAPIQVGANPSQQPGVSLYFACRRCGQVVSEQPHQKDARLRLMKSLSNS